MTSKHEPDRKALVRDEVLSTVNESFSNAVFEAIQELKLENVDVNSLLEVESRFTRTFSEFFERGLDTVFGQNAEGNKAPDALEVCETTITEDLLKELDEALQIVASRRKRYPERLALFYSKILKYRAEVANNREVDLKLPSLEELVPAIEAPVQGSNVSNAELKEEAKSVINRALAEVEKLERLSKAEEILLSSIESESEQPSNSSHKS